MATILRVPSKGIPLIRQYSYRFIRLVPGGVVIKGKTYDLDEYARGTLLEALRVKSSAEMSMEEISRHLAERAGSLRVKIIYTQEQFTSGSGGRVEWFESNRYHPLRELEFKKHLNRAKKKLYADFVDIVRIYPSGRYDTAEVKVAHSKIEESGMPVFDFVCRIRSHRRRFIASASLNDGEVFISFPETFYRVTCDLIDSSIHTPALQLLLSDGARALFGVLVGLIRDALARHGSRFLKRIKDAYQSLVCSNQLGWPQRLQAESRAGRMIAGFFNPNTIPEENITLQALRLMNKQAPPFWLPGDTARARKNDIGRRLRYLQEPGRLKSSFPRRKPDWIEVFDSDFFVGDSDVDEEEPKSIEDLVRTERERRSIKRHAARRGVTFHQETCGTSRRSPERHLG